MMYFFKISLAILLNSRLLLAHIQAIDFLPDFPFNSILENPEFPTKLCERIENPVANQGQDSLNEAVMANSLLLKTPIPNCLISKEVTN